MEAARLKCWTECSPEDLSLRRIGFITCGKSPMARPGIQRFVIATREDSQIASLAKPVLAGLSMSPDGKYLIYSQRLEAGNLMLGKDFH